MLKQGSAKSLDRLKARVIGQTNLRFVERATVGIDLLNSLGTFAGYVTVCYFKITVGIN